MVVDLGFGWGAAESSLGRLSGFYFIVSHVSTQTGLELTTRSWEAAQLHRPRQPGCPRADVSSSAQEIPCI